MVSRTVAARRRDPPPPVWPPDCQGLPLSALCPRVCGNGELRGQDIAPVTGGQLGAGEGVDRGSTRPEGHSMRWRPQASAPSSSWILAVMASRDSPSHSACARKSSSCSSFVGGAL